MLPVQPSTKE
uniref:Uncharacterized protein n=1 Tax=Arundo donax TaxID=35708 RepID=A0A0A9ESL2_ARUDO